MHTRVRSVSLAGAISRRATLQLGCIAALARFKVHAGPVNRDARLKALFRAFMAPCCWRESLLVHQSPKAEELRQEIRKQVVEGKTDNEIKRYLIGQYSRRILSLPEGALGEWLQWVPVASSAAGLFAVLLFVRRSLGRRTANRTEECPIAIPPELEEF